MVVVPPRYARFKRSRNTSVVNYGPMGKHGSGNGNPFKGKGKATIFTTSPAYYLHASRSAVAGAADTDIGGYDAKAGTNSADLNSTSGVFTAPYSTYYLVGWFGSDNVSRSVVYGDHLKKNGAIIETSPVGCYPSGGTSAHMMNSTCIVPVYLNAGDTLNLYQAGSGTHEYVNFNIATLWTDYVVHAKKAVATGTRGAAAAITGWDSVALEYDVNYTDTFDLSTGTWTCPANGNWVLGCSGYDLGISVGVQTGLHLAVYNKTGTLFAQNWGYHYITGGWGYTSTPLMMCLPLQRGFTAKVLQESAIMSNVRFWAFRLPPEANAWCIRDWDSSTTYRPGTYTGWVANDLDTNGTVNLTNGTFTLGSTNPHFYYFSAHPNPTSADGTVVEQNGAIYFTGPNELVRSRNYNASDTTTYPHFRQHSAVRIAPVGGNPNIYLHQEDVALRVATLAAFELLGT